MRSLFTIVLFGTLLLGTASAQAPVSSPPAAKTIEDEGSRKARALVDKAIAALGGPAYTSYTTRSEEGRTYNLYHGETRGAGVLYRRFYRFADKDRVEIALERSTSVMDVIPFPLPVPEGKANKRTDVALIHNGDKGYEVSYKGTEPEDAKATTDYLRRRGRSLEWVLRKWVHEPGVAFFYDGSALAANNLAEQVTIMNARNESVTLFLDATTNLPVKKAFSWRDRTDKYRNVEEEVYDNYKPVQGIMTPYTTSRFYNGDMVLQRFLSKVTYNEPLSDSLFVAREGSPTR